jgi:uncharacterized protein YecE (DUF72 family)
VTGGLTFEAVDHDHALDHVGDDRFKRAVAQPDGHHRSARIAADRAGGTRHSRRAAKRRDGQAGGARRRPQASGRTRELQGCGRVCPTSRYSAGFHVRSIPRGYDSYVPLFVGTSGWQYKDWRGTFYPREVPQRAWLEYYAERFAVVEVNNTFYRLPEPSTFEGWGQRTSPDFTFVIKASRYLTHIRRLRDPAEPVARLLDHAKSLGTKLGPILLQLPPDLQAEPDRLAETLERFPAGQRLAVEPRHASWFTDHVYELLARHDAALCLTDRAGRRGPIEHTASWTFLRMHEGTARPRPCYGDHALAGWVDRLAARWAGDDDCYVFFNNDPRACAVRDAARFAGIARKAGLEPTRAPETGDLRIA